MYKYNADRSSEYFDSLDEILQVVLDLEFLLQVIMVKQLSLQSVVSGKIYFFKVLRYYKSNF